MVALHIAAKKMLDAPVNARRTRAMGRLGAAAVSKIITPNRAQASARRWGVGRARAATSRPPTTDPPAITEVISPKTSAPLWNVNLVNIGRVTENSYAKVPTRAIISSGVRSSGVRQA